MCVSAHARAFTREQVYCMHRCVHMCVQAYTGGCIHTQVWVCVHRSVRTGICACIGSVQVCIYMHRCVCSQVSVCVRCVCVCSFACVCKGQRSMLSISLGLSPPYLWKQGLSLNPGLTHPASLASQ